MIDAVVSEHVSAPADRVRALYRDPDNWARLFPATIRGARVARLSCMRHAAGPRKKVSQQRVHDRHQQGGEPDCWAPFP